AGSFIAAPPGIAEASGADGAPRSESGVRGAGAAGSKEVVLGLVGRKGRDFFRRRAFEIRFEEIGIFQRVKYADAQRIAREAIDEFTTGRASRVYMVYNEFKSVMQQRIVTEQLLPIPKAELDSGDARLSGAPKPLGEGGP